MNLLKRFFAPAAAAGEVEVGERAGQLFDKGLNCAQAVLQAVSGSDDPQLMAMAKGFGGGIGGEKCLCGAVSGGVLALGLRGHASRSGKLVQAFRSRNKVTCCKVLSAHYAWKSAEHRANCRRLTAETARETARLLGE